MADIREQMAVAACDLRPCHDAGSCLTPSERGYCYRVGDRCLSASGRAELVAVIRKIIAANEACATEPGGVAQALDYADAIREAEALIAADPPAARALLAREAP